MAARNSYSFWHLLSRLAGLTAVAAALVGAVVWRVFDEDVIGMNILIAAGIVFVLSLLPEVIGLMRLGSSRRSAVGINVIVQVALATALLIGVNVFSYIHYERYDCTRDHLFTISDDIRQQLAKLQGATDIVLLQQHVSFGQAAGTKHDNYDAAAERQIVEKVKDLVDQFKELGAHFHVQVLDSEEEGFEEKVKAIRDKMKAPELAEAIKQAPENSIFFYSPPRTDDKKQHVPGKVQRLGFQDVYQLDRQASKTADDNRGNLILNYQGIGPLVSKILNVEEKKPRIGVAVVHPILGLSDDDVDVYTLSGVKNVLEANGFNAVDIILRKGRGANEPDAYTTDESRFEELDSLRTVLERSEKRDQTVLKEFKGILNDLRTASLKKLNDDYIHVRRPGQRTFSFVKMKDYKNALKAGAVFETSDVDENDRKREQKLFEEDVAAVSDRLEAVTTKLSDTRKEIGKLNVEGLEEKLRVKDVRARMNRALADCDLLVIPRVTMIDLAVGWAHPTSVHRLHNPQLDALKDFIKAGKPVLFCLGPSSRNPEERSPEEDDNVEKLLEDLGFKLPKQTILYPAETEALAQKSKDFFNSSKAKVDAPPVLFQWDAGLNLTGRTGRPRSTEAEAKTAATDPTSALRSSLRIFQHSMGTSKGQELKLRYARPVYFFKGKRFVENDVIMISDKSGWNEDQPFPTDEPLRIPQYEPAKATDAAFGTLAERRKGSFPIAAAVDVELPSDWFPQRSEAGWAASVIGLSCGSSGPLLGASGAGVQRKEGKVDDRIAVIGSGSVFVGKQLNPVQQKLLLDTCNWLLGRENLLARDNATWQYPRVHFSDAEYLLWQWLAVAMPLAFVYFGIVVWLVRRMR